MSSTSASAAAAHTGSERSMPSRRALTGTASRRAAGTLTAPGSRPEELHEALLDLLVPLLELLRVRGEELVLGELLEVVPAVQVHEGEHVSRDHPAVPRVRRHLLALPLGIEQILPGPRRLRGRDDLRVIGDHVDGGAQAVVVAVAVLEAG